MVVRRGRYAIYRGKEYELVIKRDGELNLISHSSQDYSLGFLPHPVLADLFTRTVTKSELEEYYSIESYAIYRGHAFRVESAGQGQLILYSSDGELADKFDFNHSEGGGFYKLVMPLLVEDIIEEREDVTL